MVLLPALAQSRLRRCLLLWIVHPPVAAWLANIIAGGAGMEWTGVIEDADATVVGTATGTFNVCLGSLLDNGCSKLRGRSLSPWFRCRGKLQCDAYM
jgi:hypothetical protein